MLRKLILKIHLYGGLLCFWYLIILAVSSFHYQHKFSYSTNPDPNKILSEKKVTVAVNKDVMAMANDLKDALDIPGWCLFWMTSRDSQGLLHTSVQNPKATYDLIYHPDSSYVHITKTNYGFWRIVKSLHAFGGKMPNGTLLKFWGIYTYLCIIVVLFSILSGIWLWAGKKGEKLIGWITVAGVMIFSLLLIFLAGFNG